ncbi:agrin-like protein [Leptotrombidium deliense]|uniref:Agrin-like protein n=1 Tax=Leptotrombidium deliense TaxID=299467 RepID=A0A443SGW8_9ACAR|nr:agrin-like protein [Leptotrombidium deliense]
MKTHGNSETVCRCPENCLEFSRVKHYLQERYKGTLKESLALISDPICGDDGKDYSNYCELMRASCSEARQINIKYNGKCGESQIAFDPCHNFPCSEKQVCKLDENRNAVCECHKYECSLQQENVTVCASNGKTYLNDCFLKQEACKTNTNIAIVAFGNCDKGMDVQQYVVE